MPLSIKTETGESTTDAVGRALERAGLADRLMAMGRRTVAQAPADWLTRDLDHELYDDRGLPR